MWARIVYVVCGAFRWLFFERSTAFKQATAAAAGSGRLYVPESQRPLRKLSMDAARAQAVAYHSQERSRFLRDLAGQMAGSLLSASEMAEAIHEVEGDSSASIARRAWELAQCLYDEGERRGAFPNVDAYVDQITQANPQFYPSE